jgi:excisionase family DNA binding protein
MVPIGDSVLRVDDQLLTPCEAATLLRMSVRNIRRWIESGRILAVRTYPGRGGRLLMRRSDVLASIGLRPAEVTKQTEEL